MRPCSIFVLTVIVNLSQMATVSSASSALDKEYEQVRKIAMRDPKVRAAFEKANERLEAKIVEIDPSLKGYKTPTATPPARVPAKTDVAAPRKQPAPAKPAPQVKSQNTHVIAAGDTFSSIAARYKVTVAELKAANPNVDEKKLRVGKVLTIPRGSQGASSSGREKPGTWDWLTSKF
jgi:LysM repeat protein